MYVIQYLSYPPWHNKWVVMPGQYPTLAEAEAAFDALPFKTGFRLAEVYVQVRYKPVKHKGGDSNKSASA